MAEPIDMPFGRQTRLSQRTLIY